MTDKDILISDLNDISEILNNNGYGGWCATILKAVDLLKEQEDMGKELTDAVELIHKKNARIIELKDLLKEQEIVRCKDCKHGEKPQTFRYYPEITWCNKHSTSHNDDWFCADGERRDG